MTNDTIENISTTISKMHFDMEPQYVTVTITFTAGGDQHDKWMETLTDKHQLRNLLML